MRTAAASSSPRSSPPPARACARLFVTELTSGDPLVAVTALDAAGGVLQTAGEPRQICA